jgi:hypothetical protein
LKINIQIMYRLVNYGDVLLLVVVSLMVRSTTGVPMFRGYGWYQTATPPSNTTTTRATTGYYTTKAAEYYTITYDVPNYYTEASKYNSASSYTTKAAECYTTKAAECYTTKAAECYTTKAAECYTTKAAECYTTKAAEYYTTNNDSAIFYKEISKY